MTTSAMASRFTTELANLRTAFRWAAGHGDLDTAAPIASYATLLGVLIAVRLLPRLHAATCGNQKSDFAS